MSVIVALLLQAAPVESAAWKARNHPEVPVLTACPLKAQGVTRSGYAAERGTVLGGNVCAATRAIIAGVRS